MPKDTTAIETSNADKVFDLPVKLDPGHVNTMSFPQDSISDMHLTTDKELVISFQDGSKVQIENFQELVNSAQSCGKDTIIQLSDNTIIYPEELNAQLAQGPVSFTQKNAQGKEIFTLNEPPAGQIVEKNIEPGHEYKLGFNTDSTASAAQAGQNLILTFKDGGVLVLKNYYTAMNAELPPAMTLADGSVVDSDALLTSCKFIETESFAQSVADEAAAATAARKGVIEEVNVEPAAGEEAAESSSASAKSAAKKGEGAPDVEPAAGNEAVADIEPAAGNAGDLSGGRGGRSFASEPSGVPFLGLGPIGAIGATQLAYDAPDARLGPTGQAPAAATVTPDSNPFGAASVAALDESSAHTVSGAVLFDFGNDGPSQTVPPVQATGDFAFAGSATGGKLTSNGADVVVTRVGDTYTGTANGATVFTFVIKSDGTYTFTQFKALDHADGADANDVINLDFGVVGTDKDGDQAVTSVTINVIDDAPVANDDGATTGQAVSGNVLTNDVVGYDATGKVISVTINGTTVNVPATGTVTIDGTYGKLVIAASGAYTYTSNNTALGTDEFSYTMQDYDGDTDTAILSVTISDLDTVPVVGNDTKTVDETAFGTTLTATGKIPSNFFGDTPGSIAANNSFTSGGSKTGGNLTSEGVAVAVTLAGNTYTGKAGATTVFTLVVNSDGSYTYTQFKTLDHADKSNPDDVINLNFGVTGTDSDGDKANGSITINVKDDGPTAVVDSATVNPATQTVAGNVTTNDNFGADGKPTHAVTKVIFNGTTYNLPTDGSNVTITSANGKLLINDKGAYTYTATTTTGGVDKFTYVIADKDGDTDTAPATSTLTITTDDVDFIPTVTSDVKTVDDTNLGPNIVTGKIVADYKGDGPGSLFGFTFESSGSKLGGNLSSGGVPLTFTATGNKTTAFANGEKVFEISMGDDGQYVFTQFKPLDHASASNPDDVITLKFNFTATDADGDKANGSITINVKDDGPTAVADVTSVSAASTTATGNVLTNDNFGKDGQPTHAITKVTFNGTTYTVPVNGSNLTITSANGKLVINDKGAYTYTATTTTGGKDVFTYTIIDKDGDTDTAASQATLTVNIDDKDFTPTVTNDTKTIDETNLGPITVTGSVAANYFSDGPGSVTTTGGFSSGGSKLGGNLTSNGVAVAVTQVGNVYTGKAGTETVFTLTVNANGSYSFVLNKPLDHADKTNPDDIINLNFGIQATDADGDKANGTITINVKDDGPTAVADVANVNPTTQTISGNVTSNDNFGQDGKPTHAVTKVIFNGTTYTLPTNGSNVTITTANGKLVINDKGAYTYTATTTTGGKDVFTYVIADKDGDTDTAPATSTLTITTDDVDYTPTVTNDTKTIDETNLGPITVTGAVNANYFSDGPGAISANGSFTSGGSKTAGNLTSNGVAVVVTQVGNVYTGKAGTETVFTMTIQPNGSYSFVLNKPLDHADKSNPNDSIALNFGVVSTDADGDKSTPGKITINVLDDAPVANDDTNSYDIITGVGQVITGNVVTGVNGGPGAADKLSVDTGNTVTKVSFNGISYDVPATGTVSVQGAYGILKLASNGSYTYTITSVGGVKPGEYGVTINDAFVYTLTDKDGDSDPAVLTLSGCGCADDVPTIGNDTKTVDETNLGPITVTGKVIANWNDDGAGPVTATGGFSSGGSKTAGNLTSGGVAVTVTQANNVYTGKAGTVTVFTLTVNPDGTYSFVLNKPLDHADKTNPDDVINLNFGVITKDADGDLSNNGTITINVKDDGPVAVADTASVSQGATTITGNVTGNDNFGQDGKPVHAVTKVIFNGTTYNLPTDGSNVTISSANGKLTINHTGQYSYTATTTTGGTDKFTYVIADKDGDTDTAPATSTLTITTDDVDYTPTVTSDTKTIDETNLSPTISINGTVSGNYQGDGPGTVTGNGSFTSGGSKLGGNLTSDGVAVVVTQSGNVYTGKAGTVTVFTLTINTDGSYNFVLNKPLDHADGTNPNDSIALNFGVIATDADGDKSTPGKITINVLDDAPVANDDINAYVGGQIGTVLNGNVVSGLNGGTGAADKLSKDVVNVVSKVSFNGVSYDVPATGTVSVQGNHGLLKLAADGTYTYTITFVGMNPTITDSFIYTLKDDDGDTDPAILTLSGADCIIDATPVIGNDTKTIDETALGPITTIGTVAADYKTDGPGTVTTTGGFSSGGSKLGGNLTSNGVAVVVTQSGNVYTGKAGTETVFTLTVNTNGSYTFVLNKPLDHADKTNPDDVINLNFGVIATDKDGDKSNNGTITINVKDDGPTAVADVANVNPTTQTISGNVTSNDNFGQDGKPTHAVTKVIFNGTTYTLPTNGSNVTITTANGKLVINDKGAYTYTATTTTGGKDVFTYVIADKDGDTDTAPATSTLTITTDDIDYTPTVTGDTKTVDETNLNPTTTVTGTVVADFKGDGPGTVTGNNTFSPGGSLFGGKLTSCGVPVVVTQVGNVYTGKAGTETVFTLTILASGAYTFVLNKNLDHGNPNNPNDSLALNFGVTATDADGDKANSTIVINVLDDGPSITGATGVVDESNMKPTTAVTGKVTADFGADHDGTIGGNNTFSFSGSALNGQLTSKGVAVTVSQVGNVYIGKAGAEEVFKLTINEDGTYNYLQSKVLDHADPKDPNDIIRLDFGVVATDCDGDKANANIVINVLDDGPTAVPTPSVVVCANNYNDLYLPATGWAANVYMTADGIGQGQQVVTVTLTGIPQGWSFFSYQGGAYNAAAGTWTKTLAPGEDFDGKFYFKAPNEVDVLNLNWTAKVTEGGYSSTASDSFKIIVGAEDHQAMAMTMMSDDVSLVDTTHASTTETSPLSKSLSLSSVIEQDNTDTQSAIDSFVYQTSAKTTSVDSAPAEAPVAASHAVAVEASPAEQVHHLQSQVA